MDFEFDPLKSAANKAKHGIDFIDAQALWSDPALLEIPARTTDEPRFLVTGLIHRKHWSAVITYRGHTIRLISVRRSRLQQKRVNVDFPLWMVERHYHEATRLGVTRQSIIKVWLAERLEQGRQTQPSQADSGLPSPQESS